jgi:hypothetical protein
LDFNIVMLTCNYIGEKMPENTFQLESLIMGKNCTGCPALSRCPAVNLVVEVQSLNEDLANDSVSPEIKVRVQGEVFAYGLSRIDSKLSEAQAAVINCIGPVAVRRGTRNDFMYPSFEEEVTDYIVLESDEELSYRGFEVKSDEAGRVFSIKDPQPRISLINLGYSSDAGLRGVVNGFRKAASFKVSK